MLTIDRILIGAIVVGLLLWTAFFGLSLVPHARRRIRYHRPPAVAYSLTNVPKPGTAITRPAAFSSRMTLSIVMPET